jgi:hypothetical protein
MTGTNDKWKTKLRKQTAAGPTWDELKKKAAVSNAATAIFDPELGRENIFDPEDLPEGVWIASEGQIVRVTENALIEYKAFDEHGRRLDPPYRMPERDEPSTPQVIRQGVPGEDVAGIVTILVLFLVTAIATAVYYHEHPRDAETWKPNDAAVIISQQETAKAQNEFGRAQAEYGAAQVHRETALRLQVIENCTKSGNIPVMIGGNVDCKLAPK